MRQPPLKQLHVQPLAHYSHAPLGAYDESQILSGMPPALRYEVATVIVRDTIGAMPIFVT